MRTHAVVRRRRGGPIRGTDARVVLGAAPGEPDARVADGIALHLIDSHLGSVAMNELDEAAALARRDLDIGDVSKALEEGAKLVFRDIARQAADEDRGVVGVRELVHWLGGHRVEVGLVVIRRHVAPGAHLVRNRGVGHHLARTTLILVRARVLIRLLLDVT